MHLIHYKDILSPIIASMELVKGQRLQERFKVVGSLNYGENRILLAQDISRGDDLVTLTIISPGQFQIEPIQELPQHIVQLESLDHSNIVLPLEYVNDSQFNAVVTEHFEGDNIETAILSMNWGFEEIICLLIQVLSALDELHQHGIVHGSLSPANILVNSDGVAKITDLWIRAPVMKIGAAHYIAPEYLKSGICETKGDVYSFGAVCFQLLTKIEYIPREFQRIIEKATHYDATKRYIDIKDLRQDFSRAAIRHQTYETRRINYYILVFSLFLLAFLGCLTIFANFSASFSR